MNDKTDSAYSAGNAFPKHTPLRMAMPQIIAVTVKNILLVAFGMTLGYPTILIAGLEDPEERFRLNNEGISWIGSINLICVPIGCIMSGAISEKIGRKRAMQVVNIPFIVAWLLFRFSTQEWHVFTALAITGLSGGFLEAPVLTYVAEVTQPHLRGMLSSASSLAVIIGVLIMFLLGTFFPWRTVAMLSGIVNIMSFNFLFLVPESPHWLITKNRLLDARKSLAWLRGWTTLEAIDAEYKQLYKEIKDGKDSYIPAIENGNNNAGKVKDEKSLKESLKLYTQRDFLVPYALVSFVFLLSHFTGMTTLQTYATKIFTTLKAPIDKYYATVILGTVGVIGCLICVILVHWAGKRILNFISILCSAVCFLAAGTYAYLINVRGFNENVIDTDNELSHHTWIPLTALISSALAFHMGSRILPWTLIGEVYSNETRAAASGLSSATSYILGFIANKTFFYMVDLITLPGVFWFYSAFSLLGFVVLYFALPETEGKTLGEINEHFAGGRKLGNHVYRGHSNKSEPQISLGTINQAYSSDMNDRNDRQISAF